MKNELDEYFISKQEPVRSCLMAMRDTILLSDDAVTLAWKYRMPIFYYKGKMFCYLWTDKKAGEPYLGIVEGDRIKHPLLEKGSRKRMSILRLDAKKDLPKKIIGAILKDALNLYRDGIIKIKPK